MAANQIQARRVATATSASVGTVDLIVLTDPGFGVDVINLTGNAPIWFTVSQPGGPCPAPTVGGSSGEFCVASVAGAHVTVHHAGQFGSVVQLIASGSTTYSVAVTGRTTNA